MRASSRGLCRHEDPEIFFQARYVDDAKAVCVQCPVLVDCQRDVMEFESGKAEDWRDGVVAGLTAAERAELDPVARKKKARKEAEKRAREKKEAGAQPAAARVPAAAPKPDLEPAAKPKKTKRRAKCPSYAAYMRHVKLKEPIDEGCAAEHSRVVRARRYSTQERAVYGPWSRGLSDADIASVTGLSRLVVRRTRERLGLIANEPKGP
jgi:hypothetical protein